MQLTAFAGVWDVDRDIEDVRAGRRGRLPVARPSCRRPTGCATARRAGWRSRAHPRSLQPAPTSGATAVAARSRCCSTMAASSTASCPTETDPGDVHACDPDTYRVRYDFRRWPRWQAEWRVTGPRKDYGMLSRFRRAEP